MEKIVVEGGKRLEGEIKVSGAKNAVLPLMAACILSEGKNIITNVPDLADVRTMAKLLQISSRRGIRQRHPHDRLFGLKQLGGPL
jgi:UDP-N-acetylglucosamine 1-carboxyvinyltransferase